MIFSPGTFFQEEFISGINRGKRGQGRNIIKIRQLKGQKFRKKNFKKNLTIFLPFFILEYRLVF